MSYLRYYGTLARQAAYSVAKGAALPLVRREAVRSGAHAMAFPISTYAPWQTDDDVHRSARDVLEWVWPRLSSGGLVIFDDYGFPACPGVTKLIDEERRRSDPLVLHLNGHGIVVKR